MVEHPFFIRQTSANEDMQTLDARKAWAAKQYADAKDAGANWGRVSSREKPVPALLVECWAERPDDEGPQRWAD